MPPARGRNTFTPVELTRLLRRLDDVVAAATRLREQVIRRLRSVRRGIRPPRIAPTRRPSAGPRP